MISIMWTSVPATPDRFLDLPILLVLVPAAASILAAVLSARSARKSQTAEVEAQRIRNLEERLADRKFDVYAPMIKSYQEAFDRKGDFDQKTQDKFVRQISDFNAWIIIYGSDEAVRAFANLQQAAFHDAPGPVNLRLYADFVLAARRDMGDMGTALTPLDVMGGRVNDLYTGDPKYRRAFTVPFNEVCQGAAWQAPWLSKSEEVDVSMETPTET